MPYCLLFIFHPHITYFNNNNLSANMLSQLFKQKQAETISLLHIGKCMSSCCICFFILGIILRKFSYYWNGIDHTSLLVMLAGTRYCICIRRSVRYSFLFYSGNKSHLIRIISLSKNLFFDYY